MRAHLRQTILLLAVVLATTPAAAGPRAQLLYATVGEATRTPPGWTQFCGDLPAECSADKTAARNVELTDAAMQELIQVNRLVNTSIRPMTDLKHHGVIEKWSYPDDGIGDCEDYALLKRKMLMERGWPRSALLMTIVRDRKGDGHAVLTVHTNKGDYVLDNQNKKVVLWTETGYKFVKRQSETDPNTWVSLGTPRPTPQVAAR